MRELARGSENSHIMEGNSMNNWVRAPFALAAAVMATACSNNSIDSVEQSRALAVQQNEAALQSLSTEIAKARAKLAQPGQENSTNGHHLVDAQVATTLKSPGIDLGESDRHFCSLHGAHADHADHAEGSDLESRIAALEAKLMAKRTENRIESANRKLLADQMDGHTSLYKLEGNYRVMVIPVQFSDAQFVSPDFIRNQAQEYLFGNHKESMSNYFRHSSLGKFEVGGEVTPIITVDGTLADYGEAIQGRSDRNARELVVQALTKLKEIKTDDNWWFGFDSWDLNDYDLDSHRHEPDGFIDAVVLIYAGKSQASCQASFDPDGSRPPSADVPAGPRRDATVECFNRIWPHRWAISLGANDPRHSTQGPIVEGIVRPSMNGLKINDHLFALDYNMQSEFSDRSTFIHEFGHSITLPDVYASRGGGNSTGAWDVMSSNGALQSQELSTYSKVSLGWVEPKIVRPGQTTSAYLGSYNYVTNSQRQNNASYNGPEKVLESFGDATHSYDVVSVTPGFGEPVYRSVVALMEPTPEEVKVVETAAEHGRNQAYSGRFDGNSRSYKVRVAVPATGNATLSFDKIHFIETETNFASNEEQIRVVVDYDIGHVIVDGTIVEELRTVSGDSDGDTLADLNSACEATRVLALRTKKIRQGLSDSEKTEFSEKTAVCQAPIWESKQYDLSAHRGKEIEVEVRYTTDAGYTEFGIILDNVKLGADVLADFEGDTAAGQFSVLENGAYDIEHSQFYMMEYRSPAEEFKVDGNEVGYNMDNNIRMGTQSMFMEQPGTLEERFRVVQQDYQPGVLVWYFNSRFDRRSNSPGVQDGKGYLLVVNSRTGEKVLPGVLGKSELLDEKGEYATGSQVFKDFVSEQRRLFKCFGAVDYYTYIDGVAPNCGDVANSDINRMRSLQFAGNPMVARRERFNEHLPIDRYGMSAVGVPMRLFAGIRTGLSTFNPADTDPSAPYTVYKSENGVMVVDEALTNAAEVYAPVSEFRDADSAIHANERFHGDTVVVEKKGFRFNVFSPSPRITSLYEMGVGEDSNSHYFRRPRVKMIFSWE